MSSQECPIIAVSHLVHVADGGENGVLPGRVGLGDVHGRMGRGRHGLLTTTTTAQWLVQLQHFYLHIYHIENVDIGPEVEMSPHSDFMR